MEQLVELDHEVFLFLNNLGGTAWDDFWNFVTNKWASIPFYMLLVFLLFKALGWKRTAVTLVVVAGMITCTDQLANVFKDAFARPRPCRQEGIMELARFVAERCGNYGYFSAHAASSAAVTVFLSLILKPFWKGIVTALVVWMVLVSYSRIYLGVHYPGDVLTGLGIGAILGYLFYRLQQYLMRKYFEQRAS